MSDFVIQAQNLTRRFGNTLAVDDLTITVRAGEVFGLLGHNGAGKTTTIRLLNGVLAPTSGSASVLGLDPTSDGATLRRKTGVLTETPSLDDRLTARNTLSIFAEIYNVPSPQVASRVEQVLQQFGLTERANDRVGSYSKGMRQRLAIARTILHEPEVIFLDEPTAGLDPVATREVHQLITHFSRQQNRTVILCTHNLYEAQRLCHRVAVLAQGKVLASGTTAELAARYGHTQRLHIEVAPEQHDQAQTLLGQNPNIRNASTGETEETPGALRIQGVGREETPALIASLTNAGIAIYRVEPEEASLEDVYFALQRGEGSDS